jgi:hypothetical protein
MQATKRIKRMMLLASTARRGASAPGMWLGMGSIL